MLVAGDPYRPAAVQQLQSWANASMCRWWPIELKPPELAAKAFDRPKKAVTPS
jgi:signal recognition particle GTPase